MIDSIVREILTKSRQWGWVLEPDAKQIMNRAGLEVPRSFLARTGDEACQFAHEIGYPVVGKVVSPRVMHKSDVHGVEVGIANDEELTKAFDRFCRSEQFHGILVEEMIYGIELIVGASVDYQFGPMILLGMGGTGVEIYRDTTLRMVPLADHDVAAMIHDLKGRRLLEGYRGSDPVNLEELTRLLIGFSNLVMILENAIDSIDLNPVLCSPERCVIADARIVLAKPMELPESRGL